MTKQLKRPVNINSLLFAHIAVIILFLVVLLLTQIPGLISQISFNLWRLISIFSFVWIIWSWYRIKGSLFNPYGLFLLAVFLFNLSPTVLSLIPGNNQVSLLNHFPQNIAIYTLILVNFCLLGLHFGALFATKLIASKKPTRGLVVTDKNLSITGYLLVIVSLYPLYLTTKESIQISISLGYDSLYRQSLSSGVLAGPVVLAAFIVPGILFLLAGGKKNKLNLVISLLLIIAYTAAQLLAGKRSIAIMPLVAYLWLWHKIIKPLKFGVIAILSSIFLFFIFPIVRLSRDFVGINRLSWQNVTNLLSVTNPFIDVFNEMGSTMQTVSHTIQIIPAYRHFDWGISYLYSLTTVFPNLFWQTHPVIMHGTFAGWLISIINPEIARLGGSIGFSFIAEAYANFGIWGGPIIIAVIGFGFVYFSEYAEKSENKAYLVVTAAYLSFFLFFARSESSGIVRPFLWYSLLPLFLAVIIKKFRTKNAK